MHKTTLLELTESFGVIVPVKRTSHCSASQSILRYGLHVLRECSDQNYHLDYEADFNTGGRLYEFLKINPSYFIYKSEEHLARYDFGLSNQRFKNWERFENIEVGDPRFPFLWKNLRRVKEILNLKPGPSPTKSWVTYGGGAGYVYPSALFNREGCLTPIEDSL